MTEQEKKETKKKPAQEDYEKGVELLESGDTAQAASFLHNALVAFEQDGDRHGIAKASDKLGDVCVARGEFEKALEHFERAYAICREETDRFSLFLIERKKARALRDWGRYEEAVPCYLDIIDEFNALRDPKGAVEYLEELAGIYLKMSDTGRAADCYRTIASIHKHFKHPKHHEMYMEKAAEVEKKA